MKKYVILILTYVMALSCAGCGSKVVGDNNTATSNQAVSDLSPDENVQETGSGEEQSSFLAKVISSEGQLLVEPFYGEWECRSSDRIEVNTRNILSEEELSSFQEGDIVQIIYDGYLLETYPARAQNTYDVIEKKLSEVFAINYSSWIVSNQKNIYDTMEGYIQKDLITEGIARADYSPDEETLTTVWNKISELDLLSIHREMTSTVLTDSDQAIGMEPCTSYEIVIRMNGRESTIKGDETAWYYRDTDEQADSFVKFVYFMNQLMMDTGEYKSLPEAVGGYV